MHSRFNWEFQGQQQQQPYQHQQQQEHQFNYKIKCYCKFQNFNQSTINNNNNNNNSNNNNNNNNNTYDNNRNYYNSNVNCQHYQPVRCHRSRYYCPHPVQFNQEQQREKFDQYPHNYQQESLVVAAAAAVASILPIKSYVSSCAQYQQKQKQHQHQQQQQQQLQQQYTQSFAHVHHLHHHHRHHHHHHHQAIETLSAKHFTSSGAITNAIPTVDNSYIPTTPSNIEATMYRRQNNLSYCSVSAQDAGQNYQVQYVDADIYHSNSSQTQMAYPFCAVGDYQTNGQSYYATTTTGNYTSTGSLNTANNHTASGGLSYLVPVDDNLLLTSSSQSHSRDSPNSLNEVAYLHESHSTPQTDSSITTTANAIGCDGADGGINANTNNVCNGDNTTPENDQTHLNNNSTNKIASATIKWLTRNYETADGVSLPRSTLYNHYIQHCNEHKLEPVNAASFGKLIRSVFSGLRTRRLGTRGNSKYHYYGIRIKPDSPLNQMMTEKDSFALQATGSSSSSHANKVTSGNGTIYHMGGDNVSNYQQNGNTTYRTVNTNSKKNYFKQVSYETCAQFLGNSSAAIPTFPPIDLDNTYGSELTHEDVELFRSMYREHCENFLEAILNLEFHTIEFLWREFWRDNNTDSSHLNDDCARNDEDKYLSKTKLNLLCHCTAIQQFVQEVDCQFYQNLVDVIMPDVLRSIPNTLTQAIRNFAKNMESWLCESMIGVPERMLQIKSVAVTAFCQTLRRYTSLNHLAQAARAVLQNSNQCAQMLHDLNRVDFHNVQEQAAWVCQCDPIIVQRLENGFKAALQQQSSLEQWAAWLQLIVDSALQDYLGKPTFDKASRQFLLKWSFYSSMVIRDLTLRSAPSFGSFHLIRLLYDEYMFYLVEHKIAKVQQKTTIAVVCDHVKRDVDCDFDYHLEYIASDSTSSEQASKRSKQE